MKKCARCGETKSEEGFYKSSIRKSGLRPYCKDCEREYARSPRGKLSRSRAMKKYDATPRGKERRKKMREKWYQHERAKWTVANAIRDNRMFRPDSCDRCGKKCIPEAHHDDYSDPMKVRWLCHECHMVNHWGHA